MCAFPYITGKQLSLQHFDHLILSLPSHSSHTLFLPTLYSFYPTKFQLFLCREREGEEAATSQHSHVVVHTLYCRTQKERKKEEAKFLSPLSSTSIQKPHSSPSPSPSINLFCYCATQQRRIHLVGVPLCTTYIKRETKEPSRYDGHRCVLRTNIPPSKPADEALLHSGSYVQYTLLGKNSVAKHYEKQFFNFSTTYGRRRKKIKHCVKGRTQEIKSVYCTIATSSSSSSSLPILSFLPAFALSPLRPPKPPFGPQNPSPLDFGLGCGSAVLKQSSQTAMYPLYITCLLLYQCCTRI